MLSLGDLKRKLDSKVKSMDHSEFESKAMMNFAAIKNQSDFASKAMKGFGESVSQIEKTSGSLAMPMFDGTNPSLWLSRIEKFFSIGRFADDLVFLCFEGVALKWFLREMSTVMDWTSFKLTLLARFDPVKNKLVCQGGCIDTESSIQEVYSSSKKDSTLDHVSAPIEELQCALQLFDKMLPGERRRKQQRKLRKHPKAWRFKFKIKSQIRQLKDCCSFAQVRSVWKRNNYKPWNQSHMSRLLCKRRIRLDLSGVQQYYGGAVKFHMKQEWRSKVILSGPAIEHNNAIDECHFVHDISLASSTLWFTLSISTTSQMQNVRTGIFRIQRLWHFLVLENTTTDSHLWHRWKTKVDTPSKLEVKLVFNEGSNMCLLVCFWPGPGLKIQEREVGCTKDVKFIPTLRGGDKSRIQLEECDKVCVCDYMVHMVLEHSMERDSGPFKGQRKLGKNWWYKFKINTRSRDTLRFCSRWMNMNRNKHHGMKPMLFQSLQEIEDLSIHVVVISECRNRNKGTSRLRVWHHWKNEAGKMQAVSEFLILSLVIFQSSKGNEGLWQQNQFRPICRMVKWRNECVTRDRTAPSFELGSGIDVLQREMQWTCEELSEATAIVLHSFQKEKFLKSWKFKYKHKELQNRRRRLLIFGQPNGSTNLCQLTILARFAAADPGSILHGHIVLIAHPTVYGKLLLQIRPATDFPEYGDILTRAAVFGIAFTDRAALLTQLILDALKFQVKHKWRFKQRLMTKWTKSIWYVAYLEMMELMCLRQVEKLEISMQRLWEAACIFF